MANPIDGSTTKVSQHALPVSLKPSNPNSFPLAYASDLRDIAYENTDLASVMGSTGQFTQAQINEALAAMGGGSSIEIVTGVFPTPAEGKVAMVFDPYHGGKMGLYVCKRANLYAWGGSYARYYTIAIPNWGLDIFDAVYTYTPGVSRAALPTDAYVSSYISTANVIFVRKFGDCSYMFERDSQNDVDNVLVWVPVRHKDVDSDIVGTESTMTATDNIGALLFVNGTNYALGSSSSLVFSNRLPLMTLGCTITFTASADFTVRLPFEYTYEDGNETVTDTPNFPAFIAGQSSLECKSGKSYLLSITAVPKYMSVYKQINVFSMTELTEATAESNGVEFDNE